MWLQLVLRPLFLMRRKFRLSTCFEKRLIALRYPEYDGAKAAVVNFVRATARILKDVRQMKNL